MSFNLTSLYKIKVTSKLQKFCIQNLLIPGTVGGSDALDLPPVVVNGPDVILGFPNVSNSTTLWCRIGTQKKQKVGRKTNLLRVFYFYQHFWKDHHCQEECEETWQEVFFSISFIILFFT